MIEIPKNVDNVIRSCAILSDYETRRITYTINESQENKTYYTTTVPNYRRPKISNVVIKENNNFVNGFKVVVTENGEYAYIRQEDNCLLPFRYDIAFDFNEYGFAIVGKDGSVAWINTDFQYLNRDGKWTTESEYYFNGWQGIRNFSKGAIPLSQLYDGRSPYATISYVGTDGEIKQFYRYDGILDIEYPEEIFRNATTFDEQGRAFADGNILFAKGYYISYEDLVKLMIDKGFMDLISADVEQCLPTKEN